MIAARMTRAGNDVTPVTGNAAITGSLSRCGYRMRELNGSEWTVPVARAPADSFATDMPGAPFDLCIAATKATTLGVAIEAARPHLADAAPIVCCQNGLPEEIAATIVGRDRVLGCIVVFGATMQEPGKYVVSARGGLKLGRPFAESPDLTPWMMPLGAVSPAVQVADLAGARWSKLALNCASSTLGAVGGVRLGALLRRRFVRRLVLEIWTEVAAVAAASGRAMVPIGGTFDIERMALTPEERTRSAGSPALALKHALLLGIGLKYRSVRSSMLVALERGRSPEIDFLNGEIVRRGAKLRVPTPVNEQLVQTVKRIFAGEERPSMNLLRKTFDEALMTASERPAAPPPAARAVP